LGGKKEEEEEEEKKNEHDMFHFFLFFFKCDNHGKSCTLISFLLGYSSLMRLNIFLMSWSLFWCLISV